MSLGILMFLIFMTLKLTGFITWSWLMITMPVIVELGLAAAVGLIVVLAAVFD